MWCDFITHKLPETPSVLTLADRLDMNLQSEKAKWDRFVSIMREFYGSVFA
jgi:hypothetical protein